MNEVSTSTTPASSDAAPSPLLTAAPGEPAAALYGGLSLSAWLKIAIVTLLMVATFRFNLVRLWLKTRPFAGEPNWQHAIFIPLIGLYYLYLNREELLSLSGAPFLFGPFQRRARSGVGSLLVCGGLAILAMSYALHFSFVYGSMLTAVARGAVVYGLAVLALDWSLGTVIFGLFLFAYGIWPGQNDFLKDIGMIVTLMGVVPLLAGWPIMRIAWFPIAFLVCALPWPELVYSEVAWPLQKLAATVAVDVLRLARVTAFNFGSTIEIYGAHDQRRLLDVAEACAGLRSLMAFISVGAAWAFLSARPMWQKVVITASAVPIAILCNVARVAGQGLLDHYVSRELSESFAHQFVGMIMLVPGFFLILFTGWLLDRVFIVVEEMDNPSLPRHGLRQWHLPRSLRYAPAAALGAPARAVARPAPSAPPENGGTAAVRAAAQSLSLRNRTVSAQRTAARIAAVHRDAAPAPARIVPPGGATSLLRRTPVAAVPPRDVPKRAAPASHDTPEAP